MSKNSVGYGAKYGDAILRRVGQAPAGVKKAAQAGLVAAEKNVAAKRAVRDAALETLGKVDHALDASLDDLALALVAAKVTKRTRPFEGLWVHAPAELARLAVAVEVTQARKLLVKLKARKPPAPVAKLSARVALAASASQKSIDALKAPQSAYASAEAARDSLLPSWTRSLARFRAFAKSALFDSPGAYAALFAAPSQLEAPRKRRATKLVQAPQPALVAPPAPTNGGGAVQP